MKTYYVIRSGWNAANQSAMYRPRKPKHKFDSGEYVLVGIEDAENEEAAIAQCGATRYSNQHIWAETNPRAIRGLTAAIREF